MGRLRNLAGTLLQSWEIGLGALKSTMTASSTGLAIDSPLTPAGFGGVTVVSAVSVVAGNELYIYLDATGGPRTATLPNPAAIAVGRTYVVQKTDATNNAVTLIPTATTINGAASFAINGSGDTVYVQYNGVEWRIINFLPGDALAIDDPTEFLILDHSASDFSGAANRAAAEADAAARSTSFDLTGFSRFVINVKMTTISGAALLNVFGRQSGIAAPDIAVALDWGHFTLPDPDRTTGFVTGQPYEGQFPLSTADVLTLSFRKWGTFGSVLVWVDTPAGTRGTVTAQRFTR